MKQLLFISLLIVTLQSCQVVGLTSDYNKTTDDQRDLIHNFEENKELQNGNIYVINAAQLKKELAKHEKSIVYCFKNGCTSSLCFPMRTYMDYAEKEGCKLFLVMNGFGDMEETLEQAAPTPYFMIDSDYYDAKFRSKYIRRFENDLLSRDLDYKGKVYLGNLFFFAKDELLEIRREL